MSEIIFDVDSPMISNRRSLLDEIDDLESSYKPTESIASYRPSKKKEKNANDSEEDPNEYGEDWLTTISRFKQEPIKASKPRRGGLFDSFDEDGGKKKKKKKKKKDDIIDYGKEFETEIQLIQNLLSEQTRFTDSLQKRYDILDNSKGTARGVGKFTTDLIGQINQARSLSGQMAMNLVNIKKNVADLNMKERKEKAGDNEDGLNISEYSADLLKQMIRESRTDTSMYEDGGPVEGTDDDIFANVELGLEDSNRSEEVDKAIQYEKRDVNIIAVVNPDTDEYHLEAVAGDNGEILEDYPLPHVRSMNINHSTEEASDEYHTKYPIRWEK